MANKQKNAVDYTSFEGFNNLSETVRNLIKLRQYGSKTDLSKIAPEYDARTAKAFIRQCDLLAEKQRNEQTFDLAFDHSKETGGVFHLSEGDGVREPEIRQGAGQYSTIKLKELTEKDKDKAFERNRDYLVGDQYKSIPMSDDEADDCLIKVVKYTKPALWASTPKNVATNLINLVHRQMSKRGADPVKLSGVLRHALLGNPSAMEKFLRNADGRGPLKFAEANNLFRYIHNFEQKFKQPSESSALHNGVLISHLLNLTLQKARETQHALSDFEPLSKSMSNRMTALNDAFSKYDFNRFDEDTRNKIGKGLVALREVIKNSHIVINVPDGMQEVFQKGARSIKMNAFEKIASKVESVKETVQSATDRMVKAGEDFLRMRDPYSMGVEWAGNGNVAVQQTNKSTNKFKP